MIETHQSSTTVTHRFTFGPDETWPDETTRDTYCYGGRIVPVRPDLVTVTVRIVDGKRAKTETVVRSRRVKKDGSLSEVEHTDFPRFGTLPSWLQAVINEATTAVEAL